VIVYPLIELLDDTFQTGYWTNNSRLMKAAGTLTPLVSIFSA